MDTQFLHLDLTVEAVLKKWPRAYLVFRTRNTDCIGCLLQRFCSLQEVAEAYQFAPQDLLADLKKSVKENDPNQRSIK